jgi:hypothetical protein
MDGNRNTEPWPCGLPCTNADDISAVCAGYIDFVSINTHLSLGFCSTA